MASFQSDFRSLKQHLRTQGGSSHHGNWLRHLQNGNPEHLEGFFVWDHVDPCSTSTIASPKIACFETVSQALRTCGADVGTWTVGSLKWFPGHPKTHSVWVKWMVIALESRHGLSRIVMGVHRYQCISVYIYCIYNLACLNEIVTIISCQITRKWWA